jgi:hypothetical protein
MVVAQTARRHQLSGARLSKRLIWRHFFFGRSVSSPQNRAMANNCSGEKPLATATAVDGGNGFDDVGATKQQHSFPPLTLQRNWTMYHPFIHEPDEKELVMYRCLMLSKPFACTAKGMDETEAWTIAAQEINYQKNIRTGKALFDPPISAEAVRERFEAVMKIAKDVQPKVPFSFTEYDPDEPEMITLLRDLDDPKHRWEMQ